MFALKWVVGSSLLFLVKVMVSHFLGFALVGKDIVFRFIIDYSSFKISSFIALIRSFYHSTSKLGLEFFLKDSKQV